MAWSSLTFVGVFLLAAVPSWSQAQVRVVTDNTSYNVGSIVRLKLIFPSSYSDPRVSDFVATVRYAGESKPLLDHVPLTLVPISADALGGYQKLWRIPADARTGRYEIELEGRDAKTREVLPRGLPAGAFVVHRKLIRINRIELDKTIYAPGDPIAPTVALENISDHALHDLRIEFSDRYWPWIGPTSGSTDLHIKTLRESLAFPPHSLRHIASSQAGVAESVKRSAFHQYAVVVWDKQRKKIYDIAFSPLVLIRAPGADSAKPYPGQYPYSELNALNTTNYRQFYPAQFDSSAIKFDRSHTMWPAGGEGAVNFSVINPSGRAWRGISIRARLVGPEAAEIAKKAIAEAMTLDPGGSPLYKETRFTLPTQPGTYRVIVELSNSSGEAFAANTLELGVNRPPKSILVFCAHEDDEMGHAGLYRAAIENHVPIHFVYFTSGDAGSCDRYYQHSCSPPEALNFGAIRMQEARAALGHLGVPSEDIFFLGLPDGGSGEIWHKHLTPSDPYFGVLLATDHAPYEGLARPNLPYARDSVVEAAKDLIKKFQPEIVYTAHPRDVRHIDHIVNNYLVVKALQGLVREGAISPRLKLLVDPVYDPKVQPRTPYRYQDFLLNVSGEVKALAQEAGWFYQSQGGTRAAGSIRTFDQLPRSERFRQVLDWQEHEGWNEATK